MKLPVIMLDWERVAEVKMNIPNAISAFRLLLAPLFFYLYSSGRGLSAVFVLALAAVSDVLDGAIARRCDMVTELGKALDPIADKLIQASMMLCAAARTPLVWLLLGLHLLRETLLAVVALRVLRVTGRVYGARWYGKLCTAVIYAVIGAILAVPALNHGVAETGVLLCALLVSVCLLLYMSSYVVILRGASGRE